MEIRTEQPGDRREIHQLTTEAFESKPFSDGTEPTIIDDLRSAGDLTLSLVAVKDDVLLGHVAFSPVVIGSRTNGCYGLGCRFGFVSDECMQYGNLPNHYVQWLSFSGQRPEGLLVFSPAFGN